ncbi:MAG: HD domain-containing protein [Schwartzia sp.]|nr:HD domain-containing protein [Schwartzia sp. (in: firmicutes)]
MRKEVLLKDLKPGMILAQALISPEGDLLMGAGTMLTVFVIALLQDPAYMTDVLPKGIGIDEMTLHVEIPVRTERLPVEDIVPARQEGGERKPPNPKDDSLLDSEYVQTYDTVMAQLEKLFNPLTISRGLDLDAIGQLIADRYLDRLCDGTRAVAQLHNMSREGNYLLHHSLHVAILAGLMGKWLHWPHEYRARLILSGLLHDVGKLKISNDIWGKASRLSQQEMSIIRRHPTYSAEILAKSGLGNEADIMAGVLQHHERGDGSGYPSGIKKDLISPFGKIIAVLDIYDAMTSNRPYAHKKSPFHVFDLLTADMMGGKIDAEYGVLFVKKVCHAQTGSWVRLQSGEKAKIIYIDQSRTNALPIVETTEGKFYDLAHDSQAKITELLTLSEAMA